MSDVLELCETRSHLAELKAQQMYISIKDAFSKIAISTYSDSITHISAGQSHIAEDALSPHYTAES